MTSFRRVLFVAALAAVYSAAVPVAAQSGGVTAENPFARPSAGMSGAGAAYMTIRAGAVADRLVSASAAVAGKVELHDHIRDGNVMRMRKIETIEIPAGGAAELKPGGLHVMLIGLKAPLKTGESFALTLVFEKAGAVTVKVPVLEMGAGMNQDMRHGMPKH